jgi:hypothetical protein
MGAVLLKGTPRLINREDHVTKGLLHEHEEKIMVHSASP